MSGQGAHWQGVRLPQNLPQGLLWKPCLPWPEPIWQHCLCLQGVRQVRKELGFREDCVVDMCTTRSAPVPAQCKSLTASLAPAHAGTHSCAPPRMPDARSKSTEPGTHKASRQSHDQVCTKHVARATCARRRLHVDADGREDRLAGVHIHSCQAPWLRGQNIQMPESLLAWVMLSP